MPRLRPGTRTVARDRPSAPQPAFQFKQAICVGGFRVPGSIEVSRGQIYDRDHWIVERYPEFWRLLGPPPDSEEVNNDAG